MLTATDSKDGKGSFVRGRVPNSLVLSGFLLLIILMIIPVWESASLLADFNYIFWAGHWEPQTIIVLCMCVLVGYVISAALYTIVDPDWTKHDSATAFFVHMFVSMVGLVYLFGALGMMKQANEISMNLMDHCAHSGLSYNTFLYSQVLHRMRRRPGCDEKMSVEECEGFTPVQPYLDYLRSAELTFRCSGFCYEAPGEEELKVIERELEGKTVGGRVVSRWPWPDGGEEKIAAAPAAAKPAPYLAKAPSPADMTSEPFSLLEGQARSGFLHQEGGAHATNAATATRAKRKHAAMLLGLAAAAGEKQHPEVHAGEHPQTVDEALKHLADQLQPAEEEEEADEPADAEEEKSEEAEAEPAEEEEEEGKETEDAKEEGEEPAKAKEEEDAEEGEEEGENKEPEETEEGEEASKEGKKEAEEKKAMKVTITKEFGPPPSATSKAKIVWNYTYAPTLFSRANFPLSCHGMAARDLTDHAGAYGELLCFQGLCLIAGASFAYVLKVIRICIRKDF